MDRNTVSTDLATTEMNGSEDRSKDTHFKVFYSKNEYMRLLVLFEINFEKTLEQLLANNYY